MERRNDEATESEAPARDPGRTPVHQRPCAGRLGSSPAENARPSRRSCMAFGRCVGKAQRRSGGAPHQSALAACRLRRRLVRRSLRASVQGAEESLLSRRRGRAHPVTRLGRGVDIGAERLRRRRQDDAGYRRRGQFRADEQSAAGGEGRRPQLPGIIQRRRFPADLDPAHARRDAARRLRRRGLRGPRRAAACGLG